MKKSLAKKCRNSYNITRKREGALCMVNSLVVANNVLQRAERDGVTDVSPMKLQKLIYLVYARYLHLSGMPLFLNKFEVWQHGPVEREVYNYFRDFGGRPIDVFAKINDRFLYVDEEESPLFRQVMDEVWGRYRNTDAWTLSEMTHEDGSAWSTMRKDGSWIIGDTEIRGDGGRFFTDGRKC